MKKGLLLILFLVMIMTQISCRCKTKDVDKMVYKVARASSAVSLNGDWDSGVWGMANTVELKNYMGERPEHFPKTQAKLLYDDENLYVFFRVEDKYVRAVAEKTNDNVCRDSCAEFFFTPSEDLSDGYFNIEINCGGTILMHYGQDNTMAERKPLEISDCERVEIFHSLPKIVEPEIAESTTWFLEYKVPFEMLGKYCSVARPKAGVKWRANFYKCADKTSRPHWLTWAVVDNPVPKFHLPSYFGVIEFE